MFKTLKEFFEARLLPTADENTGSRTASLELAAAVLMVEISLADATISVDERNVINDAMQQTFHLSEDDAASIITLAEKEVDHSISLYEFTSLVNNKLSRNEKAQIIELLWDVAFADAVLDKYEEYYIRKIADLLYVSHQDYIMAKHKTMKKNSR